MITEEQAWLMERHLQSVIQINERLNLTRIDTLEDGRILHIEDSLVGLPEIERAPEGRMADIGSGGGFPGITLAIATGRQTTLIEARKKKADALGIIIEELGLNDQVDVFNGRAELLAQTEREAYSVITARAVAKLSVLMELASPLLKRGGLLVCYKAHIDDDEKSNALRVQDHTGMRHEGERVCKLMKGEEELERRIVSFKKEREPKTKLPRREGEAQKHPL